MRKPSRQMPPYRADRRTGAIAWLATLVIVLAVVYSLRRGLPYSLAFAALIIVFAVGYAIYYRRRLTNLAQARGGRGICAFARAFDAKTVDTWIIRATFEQLQNYLEPEYSRFPIQADDDLERELLIDSEDLEDVAREIAQRAGRSLQSTEANPYFSRISTVRDLVMFLQAQPKVVPSEAESY